MSTSYYKGESVFSAGGVLVNEETKEVFLVFKKTSNEWLLPKGHMEPGESIEESAQREIYEETGYKNKIKHLLSVQVRQDLVDVSKSKIIFWFYSSLQSSDKQIDTQMSDEDFTGKWFGVEEALTALKWDEDRKLVSIIF